MKKLLKILRKIIIISVFFAAYTACAATYYVDVNGNDNNSGLSETQPWKTFYNFSIQAGKNFLPGDMILFKRGQKWQGTFGGALDFRWSGTSTNRITIGAYPDNGADPIFSGAYLLTGFTQHSGNVWKKTINLGAISHVYFNNRRGLKQTSNSLTAEFQWYYESNTLYVYSNGNPSGNYSSPGIEASYRLYGIYLNGTADYVTVQDIQLEKFSGSALEVTLNSTDAIIDNVTFYQWSTVKLASTAQPAGIYVSGSNCWIKNCDFGQNTGNEANDQNMVGFVSINAFGTNPKIEYNQIYHSSTENIDTDDQFGHGIRVYLNYGADSNPCTTKVNNNYIYHTASHGVAVSGFSKPGDIILINNNEIEYAGQAGISLFRTRAITNTVGGLGEVYGNTVSYANRLADGPGSGGNEAAGIHFNDNRDGAPGTAQPYIKWKCYKNTVRHTHQEQNDDGSDSDGIALDFDVTDVEVYQNLIHNNFGKGIYLWSAKQCKVYYNIIYGNSWGITLTGSPGELTDNNEVYNNTFYHNYNSQNPLNQNQKAEIIFGRYGNYNIIKNNIVYATANNFPYQYNYEFVNGVKNTTGNVLDYNILYRDGQDQDISCGSDDHMDFTEWKQNTVWDDNSFNEDPSLVNPSGGATGFALQSGSPAINNGTNVGLTSDYNGNNIMAQPDIGAVESYYDREVILINAQDYTTRSGNAQLGTKAGQLNTYSIWFDGPNGNITFVLNIPAATPNTWYLWARMYFEPGQGKNTFHAKMNNGDLLVLGDGDIYGQWHWDGSQGAGLSLGSITAGSNTLRIPPKEHPYEWIDQIILTNDVNFVPSNWNYAKQGLVEEQNIKLPAEFGLSQNYPNPFNPTTNIKFTLPKNSNVSLIVYDIMGAKVGEIVNKELPAGTHELKFNASNLASGIYIYQLKAGSFIQTMKMMVLK